LPPASPFAIGRMVNSTHALAAGLRRIDDKGCRIIPSTVPRLYRKESMRPAGKIIGGPLLAGSARRDAQRGIVPQAPVT
jgi:hypothetical protein